MRAARLVESVRKHNSGNLSFFLSCPLADMGLFKEKIGTEGITLLVDEDIVAASPINQAAMNSLPGTLTQQIVKSEFWRLGICENYLCLDSDSYFLRDFNRDSFLASSGAPFTVINEGLELRLFGHVNRHPKIARNIDAECSAIMEIFERRGKHYEFGPLPVVWSRKVWSDLAENFLQPKSMNFLDAIVLFPSEMRWYGEALLKYRSIELWPVETLFRCYHYEDQYIRARKSGESDETLRQVYLGVCVQSNWDEQLAYEKEAKSFASRTVRWIKRRILGRLT